MNTAAWKSSLEEVTPRTKLWIDRLGARAGGHLVGGVRTSRNDRLAGLRDARRHSVPILLRGGDSYRLSLEELTDRLGDPEVEVRTGSQVAERYTKTRANQKMPLREYIRICGHADRSDGDPPPYVGMHPVGDALEALTSSQELGGAGSDAYLWIGPPGAHTPLHTDIAHNVIVQLFGDKRIELLSPAHHHRLDLTWIYSRLIVAKPGGPPSADPHLRDSAISIGLHAGDALYIPPGWFHFAEVLTFGASITHFERRLPVEVVQAPSS